MQQSLFAAMITPADTTSAQVGTPADDATALTAPLHGALFTVLDLETTGLNAKRNSITELTAIQFKNNAETGKYSTLVRPDEVISEEITEITGITNDMVSQAPLLPMVLGQFCDFAGPTPFLVGHSVRFDLVFLREKMESTGLGAYVDRINFSRALCTKVLAQKLFPELPSYEGIVVANHCGVYNPNPHRAEYDVRMAAGILYAMITIAQERHPGIETVADLLAFQGEI